MDTCLPRSDFSWSLEVIYVRSTHLPNKYRLMLKAIPLKECGVTLLNFVIGDMAIEPYTFF